MDRDKVRDFAESEARVRHWSEILSMDEVAPTINDNEDDDGDGDEGDGSECLESKLKGRFTQALIPFKQGFSFMRRNVFPFCGIL